MQKKFSEKNRKFINMQKIKPIPRGLTKAANNIKLILSEQEMNL